MKRTHKSRIAVAIVVCMTLAACQTVKVPKFDLIKSPEFSEDAKNIATDYPSVKDAPFEPTDIRSDAQWDKDARAMESLRDRPSGITTEAGLSASDAEARYQELKAKAQAYKKDDPATGPVQGFPPYKPRR